MLLRTVLLLICAGALAGPLSAQSTDRAAPTREVEEIVVSFEVQRLLAEDVFAQFDGSTVYVPVLATFRLLEFNIDGDLERGRFLGHLSAREDKFDIDIERGKIRSSYIDRSITQDEFVLTPVDLYLRVDLFNDFFGLPLKFDFSRLRVFLPLDKELPIYQKLKRQAAHEKLINDQTELKDVRKLPQRREYFRAGVADWAISTTPIGGGGQFANLNFGSALLGGDLTLSAGGNTNTGFDAEQFRTRWRYSVNGASLITQLAAGDIFTGGSLNRSLRGGLVSNKPLVQRSHFQTTTIEGELAPEWEVEMYVDGKLRDFAFTDQSGRYRFDMDVIYGASLVELKMYGPNGEIRTEERYIRVPFNLLPGGEFEYTLAAGRNQAGDSSAIYGNGSTFYGATSWLTVGAGLDVPFDGAPGERPVFATELAAQILPNLTLNGTVSPENRTTVGLSFSKPSLVNFTGAYTTFSSDATTNSSRNRIGQKSRLALSLSSPVSFLGKSVGLRFNGTIDKFASILSKNFNYGFNAAAGPVSVNYLGKYKISSASAFSARDITSQMFAILRISSWLRPQLRAEYNHSSGELLKYGFFVGKRILRTGQLTLSVERNQVTRSNTYMLTFNLLTGFSQITSRALRLGDQTNVSQLYRGSVQIDPSTGVTHFDRNNSVGYGAAVVRPFLDENYNGVYDDGEERIYNLRAKVRGAVGERQANGLYFYERLRPYDAHLVEIDETSLDDPALTPAYENLETVVVPNMVTTIDIPIVTASDISGSVMRSTPAGPVGAGGIKIIVLNLSRDIVSEITTFNDGEFYRLGLLPGRYRAYLDAEQLARYGYRAEPESIEFEILPEPGGTSIENINFTVSAN